MSKIDSDYQASEVTANKENTSLIINNHKYIEVPVTVTSSVANNAAE